MICNECETVAHCTSHGCIPKTTKKDEALKLALEALENTTPTGFNMKRDKQFFDAITALREALAEQPKESPKFDPNESFEREKAAVARVREFMRNH